jgi:glycosyltransferase involved in cell wall biosynthesis
MKKILILSSSHPDAERERVDSLKARMSGCDFIFISPVLFKGPFRKARFDRMLKRAVASASLILVSPASGADLLHPLGKPVRPLPEGVEFDAFCGSPERYMPFPDDLFTIKNPIIGVSGVIDGESNLGYIEAAASAHPEWSFIHVGQALADLSGWKEYPNIHLLGEKPRKRLPYYISRFDVCVNLAKSEEASPLNLYQYLASGKPVVSTPHPSQVLDYTEAVYLAGTPEEFINCCKKAIAERDAWKTRRRIEYGRAASWDACAAELETLLLESE